MDKEAQVPPSGKRKQKTLAGKEIPLPKRGEIMEAFEKIAKPKPEKG
jgi:hypothetical protein